MSSGPAVAFVTCHGVPALTADDRLAVAALADLGVRAAAVRWDDETDEWQRYRAIVIRSTWDYHHHPDRFRAWIDRLESIGAPLWNPPDVLRWNTDKRYLLTLGAGDLRPPPTLVIERGSTTSLSAILGDRGWDEIVVKPVISADGFSTERASRRTAAADQPLVDAMLARGDVMIQPLVPDISTRGELSLMFFDTVFSHAVRKRPRGGEFRVQERLGGTISATAVAPALVAQASALLASSAPAALYARVDIVDAPERPVLMELELVEPSLFLAHDPESAMRFARAIVQRCAPA